MWVTGVGGVSGNANRKQARRGADRGTQCMVAAVAGERGEGNVQWTEEYAECITSTTPTTVMAVRAIEDILSERCRETNLTQTIF